VALLSENIQSTPRQLKCIRATAKYQGRKRNSTIDQLKTNVEINSHFEVLAGLNGNLRLKSYISGDEVSP
jgi:tRNA U54 and U55 pseudouridine synthase Pus10